VQCLFLTSINALIDAVFTSIFVPCENQTCQYSQSGTQEQWQTDRGK